MKFNTPSIVWSSLTSSSQSCFGIPLWEKFLRTGPTQQVKGPTWFVSTQRASRLELVFSKYQNELSEIQYVEPIENSDHSTMFFRFNHATQRPTIDVLPNTWKADYAKMQAAASAADWIVLPGTHRTSFTRTFADVTGRLIPVCRVGPRQNALAWINKSVIRMRESRTRGWKLFIQETSMFKYQMYKCRRNQCQRVMREEGRRYDESLEGTQNGFPHNLIDTAI